VKQPTLGVLADTAEVSVTDARRFYEKKRFILPISAVGVLIALGALGANIPSASSPQPGPPQAVAAGRGAQHRDDHSRRQGRC
jgi:hypothetical protein